MSGLSNADVCADILDALASAQPYSFNPRDNAHGDRLRLGADTLRWSNERAEATELDIMIEEVENLTAALDDAEERAVEAEDKLIKLKAKTCKHCGEAKPTKCVTCGHDYAT